jgi:uncharacterized protein
MFDESEERAQPEQVDDGDLDEAEFDGAYEDDVDAAEYDEHDVSENGAVRAGAADEDLRRLVYFLATNLVDDPESVVVEAEQRGQLVNLTLRVPEHELGKVIGRQGRIARAIRTILTIAGSRHNLRASLDIEG